MKRIVIEGTDGSGKLTQSLLLQEKISNAIKISFPNYNNISSIGIKHYLKFGLGCLSKNVSNINLCKFIASMYTVNRYETLHSIYKDKTKLIDYINNNDGICIFDRYVTSNMLHIGCNLNDDERKEFNEYILNLEYEVYNIPKPDLVIYLSITTEIAILNITSRNEKNNKINNDIHESLNHLTNTNRIKNDLINEYNWIKIDCINSKGEMYSIEEIHEMIMTVLRDHSII